MIRLACVAATYVVAVVGCYQPMLRDCTVECADATDCAGDQVCRVGWCTTASAAPCSEAAGGGVSADAARAVPRDSSVSTPDAYDLCPQGCSNGTCVGGVCVIDCSAPGACTNDVVCPTNLPCRVVCGDNACTNKVNCGDALDCVVECVGDEACHGEIICPVGGDCDVTCSGAASCASRTKCSGACSCDVACSGAGSCDDPSECPASSCRVGNGCSSWPVGCNTCS